MRASQELRELVTKYGDAWNCHGLEAVLALHTEDTTFHLHAGEAPAVGMPAVRAAFADSLVQWPDIHFTAEDIRFGAEHVTVRWAISATLTAPLTTPQDTSQNTHRLIRIDALDLLLWRDGRIAHKDTYVDAIAVQSQLGETSNN